MADANKNGMRISYFFKDTKPFGQLVGLFVLLLVCFVLAAGLQLAVPAGDGASGIRMELVMQGVSQLLIFLLPVVLFAVLFRERAGQFLGFCSFRWWQPLLAMLILLLLMPAIDWLTKWNDGWDLGRIGERLRAVTAASEAVVERMLSLTGAGDFMLQLLVVALVPAVCEELFFRGGVQQIFKEWFGNGHVAVIVTAFVFSIAHGDVYGLVPRFVMGLLLGYLFLYTGSIVVNICAHFLNNAVIVVMYYLYHRGTIAFNPSEQMMLPWHVVAMCGVGALLLFWLYYLKKPSDDSHKSL